MTIIFTVNGNWGAWSAWATCSQSCASGTQSRIRQCNNPAPSNAGAACVGSDTESQDCNAQACPATPGNLEKLTFPTKTDG